MRLPGRRTPPTTLRRMVSALALLAAPLAHAEPLSEAELVRKALAGPVLEADLAAVDAQARADRTATPLLDAPTLEARHEAARGAWGATTQAVGAAVTLDLGLSSLGHSRAGRLRGEAGRLRRHAVALERVCALRADATDLWAAQAEAEASGAAHDRLVALLETLAALAAAGESSGYDRDRTALAVVTHRTRALALTGQARALGARVEAFVGEPVDAVALAPLPATPSLDASLEALAGHPVLAALALQRDAARVDRDAARRDQVPDLTLAGGPRWDAAPTGGPASPGFELGGAVQFPFTDGTRAASRQHGADLAAAEATYLRARAEQEAAVRGAHHRLAALDADDAVQADPDTVWQAAFARYTAGETSLDELLQVAAAVEDAGLATIEHERLTRRAHLDRACATGRFSEPPLHAALEEALR